VSLKHQHLVRHPYASLIQTFPCKAPYRLHHTRLATQLMPPPQWQYKLLHQLGTPGELTTSLLEEVATPPLENPGKWGPTGTIPMATKSMTQRSSRRPLRIRLCQHGNRDHEARAQIALMLRNKPLSCKFDARTAKDLWDSKTHRERRGEGSISMK